jgi:hypothetical protein
MMTTQPSDREDLPGLMERLRAERFTDIPANLLAAVLRIEASGVSRQQAQKEIGRAVDDEAGGGQVADAGS